MSSPALDNLVEQYSRLHDQKTRLLEDSRDLRVRMKRISDDIKVQMSAADARFVKRPGSQNDKDGVRLSIRTSYETLTKDLIRNGLIKYWVTVLRKRLADEGRNPEEGMQDIEANAVRLATEGVDAIFSIRKAERKEEILRVTPSAKKSAVTLSDDENVEMSDEEPAAAPANPPPKRPATRKKRQSRRMEVDPPSD